MLIAVNLKFGWLSKCKANCGNQENHCDQVVQVEQSPSLSLVSDQGGEASVKEVAAYDRSNDALKSLNDEQVYDVVKKKFVEKQENELPVKKKLPWSIQ